jgi:hypothetical protein
MPFKLHPKNFKTSESETAGDDAAAASSQQPAANAAPLTR